MLNRINKTLFKYGVDYSRLIPTFLDNISVYLYRRKPRKGPCYVNLAVSGRCDFHCVYCDRWKENNFTQDPLNMEEKLNLVDQLADSGVCMLSLYDKEPLLADDLEAVISRAKKKGMAVNISTNGFLLREKAEALIGAGIDSIIISVESHIAEIHDEIRGRAGSFDRISAGIEEIKKIRKKRPRPYLSIRCLINKQTYGHLGNYIEYWKDKVDEITLKPISKNDLIHYFIPSNMQFRVDDRHSFESYYYEVLRRYPFMNNPYNRAIPLYFFEPNTLMKKYDCFAGFLFGNIGLSGNVYFCGENEHKIGNIREDKFLKIWSSPRSDKERNKLLFAKDCSCWLEFFLGGIYLTNILRRKR